MKIQKKKSGGVGVEVFVKIPKKKSGGGRVGSGWGGGG